MATQDVPEPSTATCWYCKMPIDIEELLDLPSLQAQEIDQSTIFLMLRSRHMRCPSAASVAITSPTMMLLNPLTREVSEAPPMENPTSRLLDSWNEKVKPDVETPLERRHADHVRMRDKVGVSRGTLYVWNEDVVDAESNRASATLYGVYVDEWNANFPQHVFRGGENAIGKKMLVLLAAILPVPSVRELSWEMRWSLEQPDQDATAELRGWRNAEFGLRSNSVAILEPLGAFKTFRGPGRPSGGGRFETAEEFVAAVETVKQQLRQKGRKLNKTAIARYLFAEHRVSSPTSKHDNGQLADPLRQLNRLCKKFKVTILITD